MPNGDTHEKERKKYTLPVEVFGVIVGMMGAIINEPILTVGGLSIMANWFLTSYIGPDLDQIGTTKDESRAKKKLGKWFGRIWQTYWTGYASVMNILAQFFGIAHPWYGAHRTWLTHSVPLGTVLRQIWLLLPIILVWNTWFNIYLWMVKPLIGFVLGQFVALAIADIVHIYLDNNFQESPKGKLTRRKRK